jgi:putative ABC transport system permease protein
VSARPASLLRFLLATITWPHWFEHRVRSVLTVIGVALGVATVVGVSDVSESVLASFRHTIETVAGSSALEVGARAGDLDEALVGRVSATAGVTAAAGIIESFLPVANAPEQSLYVLGVDFLGSPLLQAQIPRAAIDLPEELAFLAQLDSVMVTDTFARRAGIGHGGTLTLVAPSGPRALRVRAILGESPASHLFDGMLAVMDLPAAQRLLGRDRRLDRIAVQLAPGADVDAIGRRLQDELGPGVDVARPEVRGRQAEQLLFSLRSMLATASSLAAIVGAFIIYHTVAVSVHQRRRDLALLNTVGVDRRGIVRLCMLESLALALVGVPLGIVAGHALATLASGLVGGTASEIWVRLSVTEHVRSPFGVVAGTIVGIVIALGAAWAGSRATVLTPTVESLRPVAVEAHTAPRHLLVVVALAMLAASWFVLALPPGLGVGTMVAAVVATQIIAYTGAAVCGPWLVSTLGSAFAGLVRRVSSLPIRLGAENVPRMPWRSGATVATIAAALGMAVTLSSLVQSFEGAWIGWLEQHFGADLFVGAGARFRLVAGPPMSESVGRTIARVPGVASVEPFRVMQVRLDDGRLVFLQGMSIDDRLAHGGLAMVEGALSVAAPALKAGTGVLVSDNLAAKMRLHRGDTIAIPTPAGPRSFRVEGTYVDYVGSLDLGAVALAQPLLASIWGDRSANLFRVWIEPGRDVSTIRADVLAALGSGYYVVSGREFLDGVRSVLRQFFHATWALQLIAALVGIIGVVNSQLATVLDRRNEIAMLRTIGVSARDVIRSVLVECAALGAIGGTWGAIVGGMLGVQFVVVSLHLITGWRIPFVAPVGAAVVSVVCATLVSTAAGYVPARTAGRLLLRQPASD